MPAITDLLVLLLLSLSNKRSSIFVSTFLLFSRFPHVFFVQNTCTTINYILRITNSFSNEKCFILHFGFACSQNAEAFAFSLRTQTIKINELWILLFFIKLDLVFNEPTKHICSPFQNGKKKNKRQWIGRIRWKGQFFFWWKWPEIYFQFYSFGMNWKFIA